MKDSCPEGGYVEAWCPSCNLTSGHTIIAIVDKAPEKVKCNSCGEDHGLVTEPSMKSRRRSGVSARRSKSKETTYEEYLTRLTDGDGDKCKKYHIKGNFEKNEIIDHVKFGVGIVLSVIQVDKIKILFKDGPRLLIQNQ